MILGNGGNARGKKSDDRIVVVMVTVVGVVVLVMEMVLGRHTHSIAGKVSEKRSCEVREAGGGWWMLGMWMWNGGGG